MILLMDNGSLEPAATLALRGIAERLSQKLGQPVTPVSLLHSSGVPAEQLEGKAAEILEPTLEQRLQSGIAEFLVVPAFFGPSGALTDYLPRRIAALKTKFPSLRLRLAAPLANSADATDFRIAEILASRVREAVAGMAKMPSASAANSGPPAVILVDHGSPLREVTKVRDHIAQQLKAVLGNDAKIVVAASMERRTGPDYAFADPLLESILDQPGFNAGAVIIALLFLSPGRHAGPGGDIAQICAAATLRHPQLQPVILAPIGDHPTIVEILADRAQVGLTGQPL